MGWTSFDVVRWFKVRIKNKKIGHAGSLDPFANGVLLICIADATKNISGLMNLEKEYYGCIELGIATDTMDVTGRIIHRDKSIKLDKTFINESAQVFLGKISQIPPMYSAVKIDGRRLYNIAREGKTANREPRSVEIFSLNVIKYKHPHIFFRVECSKGTYIRTLASDWAKKLGTIGYLKTLTRSRVGLFTLKTALEMNSAEDRPGTFSLKTQDVS